MAQSLVEAGAPTFRGMYRQYNHSDYNLSKALKELVDNVYMYCDEIHIRFEMDGTTLYKISVSDNRKEGFRDLDKSGSDNPLNLAHMREGHADDSETSQFGIGLKAGSMSTAHQMIIYTNAGGYFKVVSDYKKMFEQNTFSSEKFPITREEYMSVHGLEYGTTISLEKVKPTICGDKDAGTLETEIINDMSSTYNSILQKREIRMYVQGKRIHYKAPVYDNERCKPFTREGKIYKSGDTYYMIERENHIIYNNKLGKLYTTQQAKKEAKLIKDPVEIGNAITTFVFWCDEFAYWREHKDSDNPMFPNGKIDINRQGRKLGTWFLKQSKNGSKNYNQSEITIYTKKIAEQMGLTYNKNISNDHSNNLTNALRQFVEHLSKDFNADTSTPQFEKLERVARRQGLIHNLEPEMIIEMNQVDPAEQVEQVVEPVVELVAAEQVEPVAPQVSEPTAAEDDSLVSPTKTISKFVSCKVKPHIRGSVTDEQYDTMVKYLLDHKDTFKNDSRCTNIYNSIFM